jgi:hypothetical protein
MENEKGEKLGVPIVESTEMTPEEAEAISVVTKFRNIADSRVIKEHDSILFDIKQSFLIDLLERHSDEVCRKCRLYHLLASSGRTAENVKGSFFDFTGEDSIAAFCARKLAELEAGKVDQRAA